MFLLERLPAWHSNQLSRLVKRPKLHMGDTGVDTKALECADRTLFGPLLETFVFQDLRRQVSGRALPEEFFHLRRVAGAAHRLRRARQQ